MALLLAGDGDGAFMMTTPLLVKLVDKWLSMILTDRKKTRKTTYWVNDDKPSRLSSWALPGRFGQVVVVC